MRRRLEGRTVPYIAFCGFCALSAMRDVGSEALFKNQGEKASPIFVLFIYSVVTQVVAGVALLLFPSDERPQPIVGHKMQLFWLNGFTLAAFLFYFLAIESPLGAAANSFVDYGLSPVLTAIVGALLLREGLDLTFVLSALASVGGIVILSLPRVDIHEFSKLWFLGLAFAFLSSISSAFYRVSYKVLIINGFKNSTIIFFRLFGITTALGLFLLIKPGLFRSDLLMKTAILGLVGFTLPLFLTLIVIRRMAIRNFAMLLFALPATTFFMSAGLGYTQVFPSDILAAVLVILAVLVHERATGKI